MTELHLQGRAARNAAVEAERLLPPVVLPEPADGATGWSPTEWRHRAPGADPDQEDDQG